MGNSAFTTGLIKKSALFGGVEKIATIHPALNVREFIRHDKAEARRLLGIAPDRFVLGFGAAALTDTNKGFNRFWKWRKKWRRAWAGWMRLVFGDGLSAAGSARVKVHGLGRLSSPMLQSMAYSAMDVLVVASRMETFGQVATEAQACGTPVCAFEVGGLPDAIRHGKTGFLSPFGDLDCLTNNVLLLAQNENVRCAFGQAGHDWTRANFTQAAATQSYLNLYREAADGCNSSAKKSRPTF